ncbi:hypothetical protein SDRG_04174 [Saprolegnia diclina VS20]|uniref:Uncharacterized protein n=1 Tax=Saprolegnia diclina (strain VS20) TaxID=1156394 RepID=T0QV04_SAPDV|nr:hypothetical protein SDRG_04174 [Saprolegnia diclina VS20]EQC38466.1 hypothetical protein SDRG_04174 [Saprolegnia diclina VS20]|eukprot:XP_008608058.1 hypothetical protein SDRG_04174 [Saprolegnia diclina VS20]
MSVVWPKKAWSIEEELLKKKTKSSEDKYQSLLTEYHDLRVSNAKTVAKLRELERYKEISDDIVASSSSSRRLDEKERIELSSSLRQYREKLEEAVEQICFLEKENKRLKAELTTTKLDASSSNLLLKNLDDSKFKLSTNESRLQMMRIEILELKNRKADLFSQVQDLKARLTTAEAVAEKKSDECKRLTLKLESVETAWDSTRSQNSRIQKEIRSVAEVADLNRELSEKTKVRSLELEKENETLHYKLRTRERTLEELRSDNADLKSEVAVLKKDIVDLQTLNKDLRRLTSEHNKQEKDCEHALSMNDTEIKCLREMNASSSKRIEDLVSENARLQHQLLDVHGDYLKKVQSDASWKREEKEKLRREVEEEIDVLKKPRVCKNCHETFTLEKNTAQSCVYHPGRYLPRQYPLEGYSWSCCAKRDISSRPCKFSGRHVEREVL